jgi:hypothetical protein
MQQAGIIISYQVMHGRKWNKAGALKGTIYAYAMHATLELNEE